MGKFSNSVDLAKASLDVLKKDKELAAVPVLSAVSCGVLAVLFGGGAYVTLDRIADPRPGQDAFSPTPLTYVIGVVGLFVIGIVAQFFAGVLVAGANERLEGGDPSLDSALGTAMSRAGSLVGWAVLSSTVGLVLQSLRSRGGILGNIVASSLGFAWNVVTWLAVPIIIVEGLGPIAAVKRSAQLLRQTWGENLIAQGGLGILGLLLMLPGMVVFGIVSAALPLVGLPLLFLYVAVVGSVLAALGAIYRTALYRFAAGLPTGQAFSDATLGAAFGPKKGAARLPG